MSENQSQELKRIMTLTPLIIYGVGDILGAGIYALVGKVAALSGTQVWLSFAVAMVVASLTALSYAELGSRFPKSGGVAHFSQLAFKKEWISFLVGWLMFCTCIASMATLSKAFAGYFTSFFPIFPAWLVVVALFLVLAYVVFRGMAEASKLNMLCTFMEVSGLIIVIVVSLIYLTDSSERVAEVMSSATENADTWKWLAIFQGASLAFYAFVGFEDIVNISEEVKMPERVIPLAILVALGIAGFVYIVVSFLALKVLSVEQISHSSAPLLDVVRQAAPGFPIVLFTAIALFAVLNTALLNFVTSSRLVYGMAKEKVLPDWLGKIHKKRQTPYHAILFILPVVIALALSGNLQFLAGTTATLILTLFCLVNISLLILKRETRKGEKKKHFSVPSVFPVLALLSNITLIYFASSESHRLALILLGVGVVLLGAKKFIK